MCVKNQHYMNIKLLSNIRSFLVLYFLLTVSFANAATITSAGNGNWSTASTWVGGIVPISTDNVTIVTGHTVTVTVSTSITNLSLSNTTSKLVVNNGQTLTVSGTFSNSGTTTNGVNGPGTVLFTGTATFGILTPTGVRPNITIGNGSSANTVTVSASTLIANLTINNGVTLDINSRALNVTGFITNNGTIAGTTSVTTLTGDFTNNGLVNLTTSGQLNISTGNFLNTNTGSFTIGTTGRITTTAGSFSNSGAMTYTGTGGTVGRLYLGGNYSNSGTVALGTAQVFFTGTASQSIQGFTTTGTVSMLKTGGIATFTSNVSGAALTINGTGGTLNLGLGLVHTFSGRVTLTAGILNGSSSTIKANLLSTTAWSGTGSLFTAGTGTVDFGAAGNQTVSASNPVFNNLTFSGSGIKSLPSANTINGILSMEGTATVPVSPSVAIPSYGASATLQYNTATARTAGQEWISSFIATGGVNITNTGVITLNAAKVFNASIPLTINNGAKLATANFGLTLGGNFINNGGLFTAGSSPIIIANTMTTQSIAGFTTTGLVSMTKTAGTATLGGNVNGAGFTINGTGGNLNLGSGLTHTFSGDVNLTAGILNGGSSVFNVNSSTTTAWMGTGANFVAGTGTVNFGGATQTLATASTFNNLTFSNSGVKTLTGLPTINGILSMEGAATVSAIPTYGSAATLQYNRTSAQGTGLEWKTPFTSTGGVFVTNTGVITANANKVFNANVPLIIDSDATLNTGGFSISGGSTLTVLDFSTLQISGTSFFPVFSTTFLDVDSTVDYNGTAQTVAVKNYGDLLLSNSGNKTFTGTTTISGDFEIKDTAVALLLNGTASTSGSLTLGGVLQTAIGSWGGTGSAATNINGTWFGSSTTGVVNVLTSCLTGAWLGITSTDWNTPSNWCGGSVPTATTDVSIGVNTNQPIIGAAGGICKNITIKTGATLTVSGSNTLAIKGNWTNNGAFVANTGTVNFNGTIAQSIGGSSITTFNNLTNSKTVNPLTTSIGISVKNILNNNVSTSVLNMGAFALNDGGSFSNTGAGKIITLNTSSLPLPSGKTWVNTVFYSNGTGGQKIVSGTYNASPAIEIYNTSGTQTASGNIVTGGQLNINNGGTPVFDMNGYNLTTSALNVLAPSSVIDMRGGTLIFASVVSMNGTIRFSGISNAKPFSSGTVEYNGTSQTVTTGSYFNLLFSGTGGVYTMGSDIDIANTLTVTKGDLTVKDGFTLSVGDAVTVASPGTLTFENNASLLQTTYTGSNSGNINVKRNTTPMLYYDITYWCSPTTSSQTLLDFSPLTKGDKFFSYNSMNDTFTILNPSTSVFELGKGYAIRAPENTSSTVPMVTSNQFVGVPNNGNITVAVTTPPGDVGLSLVGNPYPSAINATDFINENLYDPISNPTNTLEGTLYFWSHNNRLVGNDFSATDYYYYNLLGGAAGNTGTGNNNSPTEFIASGQGFIIQNEIAGSLKFNNTMRETSNNTNFYKVKNNNKIKELEKHRIWLNLTNSSSNVSQALVGYIENATDGYDRGYDSYVFDDTVPFLLYSLIGTDKLAIQSKGLPFLDSDTVPLGYSINTNGNATIAIDHVDGLFLDGQNIYLEDKLLNVVHNIKATPYNFNSVAGTFNDRFNLIYVNKSLGITDFDKLNTQVIVSIKNKQMKVASSTELIDEIIISDVTGKEVFHKRNVNSQELMILNLRATQQMLLVKVALQNGKVVTKKVIN